MATINELLYVSDKESLQRKTVEHIFPELKESDDESIKKWIKKELESKYVVDNTVNNVMADKALAWLEKQCSEPNWCHHKVDLSNCSEEYRKAYYDGWNNCNMQHSQCNAKRNDVVKCLINGMKFYYEDNEKATWGTDKWSMPVKHIIEVLENMSEQKPQCVVSAEAKEAMYDKPSWSEEDERMIDTIISDLERHGGKENSCYSAEINYLKSIKDRVQPQPKQEWSKEDETMLEYALDMIEWYGGKNADKSRLVSDWLKSLRPQKQWKPTEEQLDIIDMILTDGAMDDNVKSILKELKEQLRKL